MALADLSSQKCGKNGLTNLSHKIGISSCLSVLFTCLLFFSAVSPADDFNQIFYFSSSAQDVNKVVPLLLAENSVRQNPKRLKKNKGKHKYKKVLQTIKSKFPKWRSKQEKNKLLKQIAKSAPHLKRNKVLTEGIISHEGGRHDGNTIRHHVGVLAKNLTARLKNRLSQNAKVKEKKVDTKDLKIELISSFDSVKKADRFTDIVLSDKKNQRIIKEWLKNNSVFKVKSLKDLSTVIEVPKEVTRADDNFSSRNNAYGGKKSHIDKDGNLRPAKLDGKTTISQHVRGGKDVKDRSPFTSTSAEGQGSPKSYGKNLIRIDTKRLQQDINTGKVKGVEIVPPKKVQSELQSKIEAAQKRYDQNSSLRNMEKLGRAKKDLENTKRDNEALIKGIIPSGYIKQR